MQKMLLRLLSLRLRSRPAIAIGALLLTLMPVGCASNSNKFAAQDRDLPPKETVIPGREPQPDVRKTDDMSTIANRYRQAFDRANCRIEIADANYDTIRTTYAGKAPVKGGFFRRTPKAAVTECDKLRNMMQLEAQAAAKVAVK